jgi:hypothetical protein
MRAKRKSARRRFRRDDCFAAAKRNVNVQATGQLRTIFFTISLQQTKSLVIVHKQSNGVCTYKIANELPALRVNSGYVSDVKEGLSLTLLHG